MGMVESVSLVGLHSYSVASKTVRPMAARRFLILNPLFNTSSFMITACWRADDGDAHQHDWIQAEDQDVEVDDNTPGKRSADFEANAGSQEPMAPMKKKKDVYFEHAKQKWEMEVIRFRGPTIHLKPLLRLTSCEAKGSGAESSERLDCWALRNAFDYRMAAFGKSASTYFGPFRDCWQNQSMTPYQLHGVLALNSLRQQRALTLYCCTLIPLVMLCVAHYHPTNLHSKCFVATLVWCAERRYTLAGRRCRKGTLLRETMAPSCVGVSHCCLMLRYDLLHAMGHAV